MFVTADRVLETIAASQDSEEVLVFWWQVTTGRSAARDELLARRGSLALVPLVVRNNQFTNPNAIATDLFDLLDANETEVRDWVQSWGERSGSLAIVLISALPLGVPQLSSPCVMPKWLPRLGGQIVPVRIQDLAGTAESTINALESRIPDVCEAIWCLEQALLRRIRNVRSANHASSSAFFDFIRDTDESIEPFLERAIAYGAKANAREYRPSARDGVALVGRILRLVSKTSPDELGRVAKGLSRALQLPPEGYNPADSLVSVTLRSTSVIADRPTAYARAILSGLYCASQLVTASKHAGEYPSYPIVILQGMSFDLRRSLVAQKELIESLGPTEQ